MKPAPEELVAGIDDKAGRPKRPEWRSRSVPGVWRSARSRASTDLRPGSRRIDRICACRGMRERQCRQKEEYSWSHSREKGQMMDSGHLRSLACNQEVVRK